MMSLLKVPFFLYPHDDRQLQTQVTLSILASVTGMTNQLIGPYKFCHSFREFISPTQDAKCIRMLLSSQLLLALTFTNSLAINVEKLFKEKISDARCFSQCQQAETEEDQDQCFVICKSLADHPQEDLCSLTAICTGGCQVACEAAVQSSQEDVFLQHVSFSQCQLSWDVEKPSEDVVYLLAGRDQGGMWSLVVNHMTSQHTDLTPRQAAKFVELQVFAISPLKVSDIISIDIRNNDCHERVPVFREWREEEHKAEQSMKDNTSLVATIVLSVLGVFAFVFSVALVIVKVRTSGEEEAAGEDYDYIPELPYTVPVRALETLRDQTILQHDKSAEPSSDYEVVEIRSA